MKIFNKNNIKNFINKKNIKKKYYPKDRKELGFLIEGIINNEGINCNLNHIDTSLITDMSFLFCNSKFNGNISKWNVSNVIDMDFMFDNSEFNGDISKWNVSKLKTANYMFSSSLFDQNISNWNIQNLESSIGIFSNSKIKIININLDFSKVIYNDFLNFKDSNN